MPYREVAKYALVYQNRPGFYVQVVGESVMRRLVVAPADEVFVADILRNEKPLYFDLDRQVLSTANEDPGEEES